MSGLQDFRDSRGVVDLELWGRFVESSVVTHLKYHRDSACVQLLAVRAAVADFMVSGMSGIFATEVKSGR